MPNLDNKPTRWQNVAKELFFAEFDNPKDFYAKFDHPSALYAELAHRIIRTEVDVDIRPSRVDANAHYADLSAHSVENLYDAAAYALMYQAFEADALCGNTAELDKLITTYSA